MFGGLGSQVQVLGAWGAPSGLQTSSGRSSSFFRFPRWWNPRRVRFTAWSDWCGQVLPTCLNAAFSLCWLCRSQTVFRFFSEDFVPCVAVHSGCLSEVVPFRPLLRRHLRPELYLSPHNLPWRVFTICNQSSHAPAKYLILASLNDGIKLWVISVGQTSISAVPLHSKLFWFFF